MNELFFRTLIDQHIWGYACNRLKTFGDIEHGGGSTL